MATTPLTKWLYPVWYQTKMTKWRRGEIDRDGKVINSPFGGQNSVQELSSAQIRRLLVYLRLDSLPSLFTFVALLGADKEVEKIGEIEAPKRPLEVHGLRILELTERTSSVMQVTEGEEYYSERDPVVNAFRAFSRLNDVAVSGRVAIVPMASYAETLMKQASDITSDFALVPWSEYGSISEETSVLDVTSTQDRFTGRGHLEFINQVLLNPTCNTGIFINNGFGGSSEKRGLKRTKSARSIHSQLGEATILPVKDKSHQLFFPFFGGVHDRVTLRFALRLARNPNVTLTIAHFNSSPVDSADDISVPGKAHGLLGSKDGEVKVLEESMSAQDQVLLATLQSALPHELVGRVTVTEINVTRGAAVASAVSQAKNTVGNVPKNSGDIILVGQYHADLGDDQIEVGGSELRRTVGVAAEQLVNSGINASILVIKAGGAGLNW